METKDAGVFFIVRCVRCGGSGRIEQDRPCQICRCEGCILLPGSVEDYRDCSNCAGSGYVGFNLHNTCGRCLGTGALRQVQAGKVADAAGEPEASAVQ